MSDRGGGRSQCTCWDATNNNAVKLIAILDSFACTQHVPLTPTHRDGGTIDLIITKSEQTLHDVDPGKVISDHSLISWWLPLQHQPPIAVHRRTRQWMKLDKDGFRDALLNSELCSIDSRPESEVEYFDTYHRVLTTLADQVASVKKITVRRQQIAAWMDDECRQLRRQSRRLERRYRKRCNQLIRSRGWNRNASGTKHTVGRKHVLKSAAR